METYITPDGSTIDVGNRTLDVVALSPLASFLSAINKADLTVLNVTFKTNNAGKAVSIESVQLQANSTYSATFINELVKLDGITINGVASVETDRTADAVNVTGNYVTLKDFTIANNLTVSGNNFTSVKNHITGNVIVNGLNASFNTEIDGDVRDTGTGSMSHVPS